MNSQKLFTKKQILMITDFTDQVNKIIDQEADRFFVKTLKLDKRFILKLTHQEIDYINFFDIIEYVDFVIAFFNLNINKDVELVQNIWDQVWAKHIFE